MHKLFTNPDHPLVFHKRRKFAPECLKVIEEEVVKLIKVSVIKEAYYPDWLANVVVAPKRGSGEYALTLPILTRHVQKIIFLCQKLT